MRIAVVHPKFDHSGGAERYALELATGLAGRGHEVHLFGRRAEDPGPGTVFHRVPAIPFGRALKTYSFETLTRKAVQKGKFQVVQGFGKTTCQTVHRTGGGVHRAYVEREGGNRVTRYDRVALRIEDRLFSFHRLRAVICPSTWVRAEVVRFYPAVTDRVRVIPNGVDLGAFSPPATAEDRRAPLLALGLPREGPVLLFVATNFRLKGLDMALDALAQVGGSHLVVVGGDRAEPFLRQAAEVGCADRLHFLGKRSDPAALYRAADVLVHPTRYDPFANVCLEALACGTPVVTTPENGAADLLADGRGGVVVPRETRAIALAEAIQEVLSRGESGRKAARAIACENGSERHLDRIEALYREVAGRMSAKGNDPAADRGESRGR